MGDEARCSLVRDGVAAEGRAHLESDRVLFRGATRATILFSEVSSAALEGDGDLVLGLPSGPVRLAGLGAKAPRWLKAIRQPKSVLDKLGVREGMRVALVGVEDPTFISELEARGVVLARGEAGPCDAIFFAVSEPGVLDRLAALRGRLAPDGAIWVLRPKGAGTPVGELLVYDAGRAAGLVDTKVVAFSATLSAAKLVIPVAQRAGAGPS